MSNRTLLTLELTTKQDDDRPVYVAGNFCDWFPDVSNFEMTKLKKGKYKFTFSPEIKLPEILEYKYTKGGWNHVELDKLGNTPQNRQIKSKTGKYEDFVPFWRNDGSTAFIKKLMPKTKVLAEKFEIPQLKTSRKIHILLPHDYEQNTEKKYPVLYLQDAQNLFGNGSTYGNWEIDKRLSLLAKQEKADIIIVAIEHGEKDRFIEYSPYSIPKKGKAVGMKYANFLAKTLKPFIDSQFRTQKETEFTGIGGSSMGGLISMYAGIMYPEIFGRMMVFSPSFWVSQKIFFDTTEFFQPQKSKIYLFGGAKEGNFMIPSLKKMKETIENQGFGENRVEIKLVTDAKGEHTEKRWGQEFPKALEWLFG